MCLLQCEWKPKGTVLHVSSRRTVSQSFSWGQQFACGSALLYHTAVQRHRRFQASDMAIAAVELLPVSIRGWSFLIMAEFH